MNKSKLALLGLTCISVLAAQARNKQPDILMAWRNASGAHESHKTKDNQ